jgi:RNA polymerase sigma factor FliA
MSAAHAMHEARAKRTLSRAEYERFLPLVRRTAMKLARRLPSTVSVSDLVGYGWLGLLDAFDRASPDMDPAEFEAYARYRIRGAALDWLRTLDPSSRAARALSRKIATTMSALATELGRQPDEAEIARRLEMSEIEYRSALESVGRAGMNRLEMLDIDEVEVDAEAELPDERASKKELHAVVTSAIEALPERLQLVLSLYYSEERTLREIGAILDVSESRVSQLHTEAIHLLRAAAGRA